MKVAAIYARVSTDRQKDEQTIDSQISALIEFAHAEGYTIPSELVLKDEGYSGSTLIRPGLEHLRDLTAEGQIETVLVYSPDRLSRKYAYQVLLIEELNRNGVEVLFVKSPQATTPEEQLLVQFQGMIAEYERAQIAERTRRGKKYRAKCGSVNVLVKAPYGFRYVKKTETSDAFYEIIEREAEVVREIYRFYTEEELSINGIARWLNEQGISTKTGKAAWCRNTIWNILRNPAYKGKACFNKTERVERKKNTRPSRMRGGFSPYKSRRERPKNEWIEIPVPAIITEETFALAEEHLKRNKLFASRNTKKHSLLQGLVICSVCGYAYYRYESRTPKKSYYYYRCTGSQGHRGFKGPICHNSPIHQDYLDELVWEHIFKLLENPELIHEEIERRMKETKNSIPTKRRKEAITKELNRIQKGIDKLLDAYQEDLLPLPELRKRIPQLRKREKSIRFELQNLETNSMEQKNYVQLYENIGTFLSRMRGAAEHMTTEEKQKIIRLVVKEILIGPDTLTIKHSIPISKSPKSHDLEISRLRSCSPGNTPGFQSTAQLRYLPQAK